MDISSLLNPVEAEAPSRHLHLRSIEYDGRPCVSVVASPENGVRPEATELHSPATETSSVTPQGSFQIQCHEGSGVNPPGTPSSASYKYLSNARPASAVKLSPPEYPCQVFANPENSFNTPIATRTSWFRTIRPLQQTAVDLFPSMCAAPGDRHPNRRESRSAGSSMSSPSSLRGLRGSLNRSPCSAAADSSLDGSRSGFSGSPRDYGSLTSPTDSLVAFASVAIGDYGLASGMPGTAEAQGDTTGTLTSSVDLVLGTLLKTESTGSDALSSSSDIPRGQLACVSDFPPAQQTPLFKGQAQSDHRRLDHSASATETASREAFEKCHDQIRLHATRKMVEEGSPASPLSSELSVDSEVDETSTANRVTRTTSQSTHFSQRRRESAGIALAGGLQPRVPIGSASASQRDGSSLSTTTAGTGPRCSYTANCTTGSPLRKVVSHIFGRNKLCTRQIPKEVWVHYCRKHYQRSRYRNPRGFALLQCDLVRKQIERLQEWGGVTEWIIKVRKREEERLNKESAELAAAAAAAAAPTASVARIGSGLGPAGARAGTTTRRESGDSKSGITLGSIVGVWGWLVRSTGSGKSTSDVLRLLDRVEGEIASSGSNFPDVEILPIVTPGASSSPERKMMMMGWGMKDSAAGGLAPRASSPPPPSSTWPGLPGGAIVRNGESLVTGLGATTRIVGGDDGATATTTAPRKRRMGTSSSQTSLATTAYVDPPRDDNDGDDDHDHHAVMQGFYPVVVVEHQRRRSRQTKRARMVGVGSEMKRYCDDDDDDENHDDEEDVGHDVDGYEDDEEDEEDEDEDEEEEGGGLGLGLRRRGVHMTTNKGRRAGGEGGGEAESGLRRSTRASLLRRRRTMTTMMMKD